MPHHEPIPSFLTFLGEDFYPFYFSFWVLGSSFSNVLSLCNRCIDWCLVGLCLFLLGLTSPSVFFIQFLRKWWPILFLCLPAIINFKGYVYQPGGFSSNTSSEHWSFLLISRALCRRKVTFTTWTCSGAFGSVSVCFVQAWQILPKNSEGTVSPPPPFLQNSLCLIQVFFFRNFFLKPFQYVIFFQGYNPTWVGGSLGLFW